MLLVDIFFTEYKSIFLAVGRTKTYGGTELTLRHICFSIINLYVSYLNYWLIYIMSIIDFKSIFPSNIDNYISYLEIRYIIVNYWERYFSRRQFGATVKTSMTWGFFLQKISYWLTTYLFAFYPYIFFSVFHKKKNRWVTHHYLLLTWPIFGRNWKRTELSWEKVELTSMWVNFLSRVFFFF